jgi:prepilin-type N-terminal cleavage/methylation domain-containing protein
MKQRRTSSLPLANNAGFTLLEIIAVLVIMGILAVVAVPRYFDLQSQAKLKAFATGKAEAIGRVNSYFAQRILAGDLPSAIIYSDSTIGTDLGDFTLSVSSSGNTITLIVNGDNNTPMAGLSSTISIIRPGSI